MGGEGKSNIEEEKARCCNNTKSRKERGVCVKQQKYCMFLFENTLQIRSTLFDDCSFSASIEGRIRTLYSNCMPSRVSLCLSFELATGRDYK
jgi:hypothetical protein